MPGVTKTVVGYTGGQGKNPTYDSVCANDGHTEAIQIEFDPEKVSYEELLEVFWKAHHPSDGKAQYKSAIWYQDEEQRRIAEASCKKNGSRGAVVTLDEVKLQMLLIVCAIS